MLGLLPGILGGHRAIRPLVVADSCNTVFPPQQRTHAIIACACSMIGARGANGGVRRGRALLELTVVLTVGSGLGAGLDRCSC